MVDELKASMQQGNKIHDFEIRNYDLQTITHDLNLTTTQGNAQRISRLKLIRDRKIDERVQPRMQQSTDVIVGDEIGDGAHGIVCECPA
jgi:hypothetical protein